jgi:TrmH family RNA methyltransferase
MITSSQNAKIKRVRALLGRARERHAAGAFVVEGVRLVEDAETRDWRFRFAFYDESLSERGLKLVKKLEDKKVEVEKVEVRLMRSLSETETPQGILAVLEISNQPIPNLLNFVLIPDQIRDPGNLGTLFRSAVAAGVQAVLLTPETTDAFAPKVLRSGMGAHFRLPIHPMTWAQIREQTKGLQIYLADIEGQTCWETNLRQPLALLVGGEAEGASAEARKLATQTISIPMLGSMESLNAGVAGSVLMFEVLRQRRTALS